MPHVWGSPANLNLIHPIMNYQPILRRLRQKAFDYPPEMDNKFARVITKVKARSMAQETREPQKRGPFSGLTRHELAASRTCETDWF